ncbi:hypothetical protein LCGC14_0778940 [marine sediment metagenome]|uniref:Uncharacterized protein n=1 Tax=marine sediment metagenome TaxID=412755 RepID=A0A0F9PW90_9ZZZZ
MAKKLPTADAFAEKWNRRIKASTPDIRAGLEGVEEAPTLAAVAKKDKFKTRLMEAIDNGKWEAGLRRVSLEEWRSAAINKGVPRIAAGADEAQGKVQEFAAEILPHIASGQAAVNKLPDFTIEDSINRVGTFMRHMSNFKRGRRA